MKPSTKTFQQGGKWIERTVRSVVLVCACGNKYLKTRKDQNVCHTCLRKELPR